MLLKLIQWIKNHILCTWEVIDEDGQDCMHGYEGFTKYRKGSRIVQHNVSDNNITLAEELEFSCFGHRVTITGALDTELWTTGITIKKETKNEVTAKAL